MEQDNATKLDAIKGLMKIVFVLSAFVLPIITIVMWFNHNSNTQVVFYITFFIWAGITYWGKTKNIEKMNNFKSNLSPVNGDVFTYDVKYLGGHVEFIISSPTIGKVGIGESNIGYIAEYNEINFKISYADIVEATEESKESITLGRFIMIGILALALKKKTKYLRIAYKNDIGEMNNVIFETADAHYLAQKINQSRYQYIKANKVSNSATGQGCCFK